MELQFENNRISCLQQVKWEVKNQELTQEVRLTEQQPDIGSILGAWGQCLLLGKQWHSGSMEVSGGIMAFVLYSPEDGGSSRNVQTWLPFSFRWDLPQTKHDGIIQVRCRLTCMDARSASARKIIVRADVQAVAEALVPEEMEMPKVKDVPEDLQLKTIRVPVTIPTEAGEKAFSIEETLEFSGGAQVPERMVRYDIHPEIIDRKVMSDKVVFRGTAIVHTLFANGEGLLQSRDFEVPFSQYAQLDQDHDPEASCSVIPAVTALEIEQNEQLAWQMKAGFACQYVVYDKLDLDLTQDVYSNIREVKPQITQIELPMVLEMNERLVNLQSSMDVQGSRSVDGAIYIQQPRFEDGQILLTGTAQLLYTDMEGQMQCKDTAWSHRVPFSAEDSARVQAAAIQSGQIRCSVSPSGGEVQWDLLLSTLLESNEGLGQLSKAELSDPKTPDPNRPSLILRKAGQEDLWTLAKRCGSTEEAIRRANNLEGAIEPGRLLLIPVQ